MAYRISLPGHGSPQLQRYGLACLLVMAAFAVRLTLFRFQSLDYVHFLSGWYSMFAQHGLSGALRIPFSNYTPSYLYLLGLFEAAFPWIWPNHAIKLVSFMGDGLAAVLAYQLTRRIYPSNPAAAYMAFIAVLFSPHLIANGAATAQCDIWYSLPLLAAFASLQTRRPRMALLWLGIALSVKPWAAFFIPYMGTFLFTGTIRWRDLWIVPATYYATFIPAMAAGRDFFNMSDIYATHMHDFLRIGLLTWNAPSVHHLLSSVLAIPGDYNLLLAITTTAIAGLACLAILWCNVRTYATLAGGACMQLLAASLVLSVVPYLLPFMHERYFFAGDLFVLLLACWQPRFIVAALALNAGSLLSYSYFMVPWMDSVNSQAWQNHLTAAFILKSVGIAILLRAYVQGIRHARNEASPLR